MVDDWHAFYGTRGWKSRELKYYAAESHRLGRPMPMWARIITRFIPKKKLIEDSQFAGYALLERS